MTMILTAIGIAVGVAFFLTIALSADKFFGKKGD
jgi:hypothetical protein